MQKSFRDIIENLRNMLVKIEASHATMGKILTGLKNWRTNGENGIRIGNGDTNSLGWNHFLHGRMAKNLREILPRVAEADNKKGSKMVEEIIMAVIKGAEAAWRTRCELAAAAGIAGLALSRKMRTAAKVETLLYELKKTRVASMVEANAAQILSRPEV